MSLAKSGFIFLENSMTAIFSGLFYQSALSIEAIQFWQLHMCSAYWNTSFLKLWTNFL